LQNGLLHYGSPSFFPVLEEAPFLPNKAVMLFLLYSCSADLPASVELFQATGSRSLLVEFSVPAYLKPINSEQETSPPGLALLPASRRCASLSQVKNTLGGKGAHGFLTKILVTFL
jgi:hypothetical protein